MINRKTLIRVADSLEDLMVECGKGETRDDREVYWSCRAFWIVIQNLLKKIDKIGERDQ